MKDHKIKKSASKKKDAPIFDKDFKDAVAFTLKRHRKTFEKLAKN